MSDSDLGVILNSLSKSKNQILDGTSSIKDINGIKWIPEIGFEYKPLKELFNKTIAETTLRWVSSTDDVLTLYYTVTAYGEDRSYCTLIYADSKAFIEEYYSSKTNIKSCDFLIREPKLNRSMLLANEKLYIYNSFDAKVFTISADTTINLKGAGDRNYYKNQKLIFGDVVLVDNGYVFTINIYDVVNNILITRSLVSEQASVVRLDFKSHKDTNYVIGYTTLGATPVILINTITNEIKLIPPISDLSYCTNMINDDYYIVLSRNENQYISKVIVKDIENDRTLHESDIFIRQNVGSSTLTTIYHNGLFVIYLRHPSSAPLYVYDWKTNTIYSANGYSNPHFLLSNPAGPRGNIFPNSTVIPIVEFLIKDDNASRIYTLFELVTCIAKYHRI